MDPLKRQTATATPAEPGVSLVLLDSKTASETCRDEGAW